MDIEKQEFENINLIISDDILQHKLEKKLNLYWTMLKMLS